MYLKKRLAGATGSIITCPLEVVKTRLQSSKNCYQNLMLSSKNISSNTGGQSTNGNNLNNRIRLANKLQSCSFNTSILFKNNHLNHHHTSVMSNAVNFDSHLVNHHSKYSINKLAVHNPPRPGTGIYLYFK